MRDGLSFVASSVSLSGVLLFLFGIGLSLMGDGGMKSLDGRLKSLWEEVVACNVRKMIELNLIIAQKTLTRLFDRYFIEADQYQGASILFLGILFLFIPAASTLNALVGGTPLLFKVYLFAFCLLVILLFFGQSRSRQGTLARLNGFFASALWIVLMLVIPAYVVVSFTERISHENISHGFLTSLLIAPFYYVFAMGVKLSLEGLSFSSNSRTGTFVFRFLAALPVSFVCVFFALLLGQVAMAVPTPPQSLQTLFVSIGLTALSFPITLFLLSSRNLTGLLQTTLVMFLSGAVLSFGLGVYLQFDISGQLDLRELFHTFLAFGADGRGLFLGADFWVSHLPFLPFVWFVLVMFLGLSAKLLHVIWGGIPVKMNVVERPVLASGLLFVMVGGGLFLAGRIIA